ncbi:MAG: 1,4-dihydroxy-2-naphthoate polyprenyltransferase [Chloroflexi bacterium]|nr:1,4-dihydroxy-2-naphthoate polyprenyltransferase [Chloroflexota bacterium]
MTTPSPVSVPPIQQIWLNAARPRTLPASLAPVLVGLGVAWHDGQFQWLPALATILTALLLQIAANLANDVFDFHKGADTHTRLGPPRATQMGWLTPRQMLMGLGVVLALAGLLGLYLVYVGGIPILVIGILAMFFAVAYTAGPLPLAYLGLGDLFAFLFFGPIAVGGTYYLQTGSVNVLAVGSGVPIGFLVTNILVVNNLRDIETDRAAGKKTLAARFGARFARVEFVTLLCGAYLMPVILILLGQAGIGLLLTWLSIPLAMRVTRIVWREQGRVLNQALARQAQFVLIFAVSWCIGVLVLI